MQFDAAPNALPEYVTEIAYQRGFIHQLTPASLRLVAALNGVAPPLEDDFDYLELGTASGDTLLTLAAANPRARFLGVDVNATSVAFARELAAKRGLSNVRFVERDLSALRVEEFPKFDYVGAHGLLTWVGPEKRRDVIDLARRALKPGGLLYVSYNALPGWAAIEPLRRLFLETPTVEGEPALARAKRGCELLSKLDAANAGYLISHPTAKSMLSLIDRAGFRYVVHEYFHANWYPMYFADLAREMSAGGLDFVGQLPLAMNVRELALPPPMRQLASTAKTRVAYETLKDYALNEFFRSDVFVNGTAAPDESVRRAFFETTPFGTTTPAAQVKRSAKLPFYTLAYEGPVYDRILGAIAGGAKTATEVAAEARANAASEATQATREALDAKRIGDCLMNLSLGGQVVPMRLLERGEAGDAPWAIPLAHNRFVLEDILSGGESPRALASPATGGGFPITLLDALSLYLWTQVEPSQRTSWLRRFSHQAAPKLTVNGRTIENADELVKVVSRAIHSLAKHGAAKLAELGIIAPACPAAKNA
jgi:SAM-dependent methyltransferase